MADKQATTQRDGFKSKWGFILACIGSAVGMGNIWRFPIMVSIWGGMTFLIPYFICVILIGSTGVIGEFALGRAAGAGPVDAFGMCTETRWGKRRPGELVGYIPVLGSLALAIGYTCYHMPEPLLNLGNCFSVRLRAPRTGSLDIATYYMSNYTCEYARALVERGMEGGYQFLDALAGVDACSMMNRAMEHFEILQMNDKPNFFVSHCDIPYKVTDYTLDSYVRQMRRRVLEPLAEK